MLHDNYGLLELPEIARRENGKPFFANHPEIEFNVSDSNGCSLCALSDFPIGVDVEFIKPRKDGLARHVFSSREWEWFCSRGSKWEDFYILWTLKEAKVKCTGMGLRIPACEISVPLIDSGEEAYFDGFHFTALSIENFKGAICEFDPKRTGATSGILPS